MKFDDETLEELHYFRSCYMRVIGAERPRSLTNTRFLHVDGNQSEERVTQLIY